MKLICKCGKVFQCSPEIIPIRDKQLEFCPFCDPEYFDEKQASKETLK